MISPDIMRSYMGDIITALKQHGCEDELVEKAKRVLSVFVKLDQPLQKADYKNALLAQSACNLSGIVFEFGETMHRLCREARLQNGDTEWRNQHPICRLYAEQITHLTRPKAYMTAYAECEEEVS